MAFVQIRSTNPMFSYILGKNPAAGMLIKPNRKGRLFAWYTVNDPQIFNIYFRDSDTEVSYSEEEFEYMDATRYNAPIFLVNACSEFLSHMKKADDKDITGYENTLMINQIRCKAKSLAAFQANFTDYEFETEEVSLNNYKITIKTKKTLRELISLGQILSVFNTLLYNELRNINYNDIDKYMNWIQVTDAPYYIRHLFKLYFLKTHKLFNAYKSLLETSDRVKIEFEIGSTLDQRIAAVKKYIDPKLNIIDIGCGEGSYIRAFAANLVEDVMYHAIDNNPEQIEVVKKLCVRKQLENVVTWSSIDEFMDANTDTVTGAGAIILLTEVIEHMSKEDVVILLNKVFSLYNNIDSNKMMKIIVTTPNKDFNNNYKLFEDDVRNNDHKFEMVKEEFRNFIQELVDTNHILNEHVTFFEIGDRVDGVQPTLAVAIIKDLTNKTINK